MSIDSFLTKQCFSGILGSAGDGNWGSTKSELQGIPH